MRFFSSFGIVLVFLCGLVCGNCWGGMARAQLQRRAVDAELEARASPLQRAYALDVARTAVNEASLAASPRDVDIVYEASRFHGSDDASRLRWLRRHSACTNPRGDCDRNGVLDEFDDEAARARPGNAGWTRELRWDDARPPSLVGRWRPIWWARVRDRAQCGLRLIVSAIPNRMGCLSFAFRNLLPYTDACLTHQLVRQRRVLFETEHVARPYCIRYTKNECRAMGSSAPP